MDFTIPKHLQLFRRMVQEFAEQEVRPVAKQVDRQDWPDMNVVRKLGENGLLGVPFPQKYGGAGLGELGYCLLMETMGSVCTSTATTIGAHIGIGAMSIYLGGNEAQKRKYLPDLATGKKIAAFCLTEPGAGSDAAAIKTRAIREGDKYIISGSKMYITNGPIAETLTVLAVTDPALGARGGVTAFIVENGTPGLSVGTIEHKMGIRGSATSEIVLDEVVVPSANVLGQVGAGFITFMASLDTGRLGLGAACLGGAQAALDAMCRYAAGRTQFGKAIGEKQAVQWIIANTATEVEALRSLVYRTAWLVDTGQPYTREGAMCKLLGSELASRAVDRAIQVHGALGYDRDFPLERNWRDARIAEIFEGTNEIQRIVIAGQVLRPYGVRVSS
jgi:acyl-CoA dehydrogenase